MDSIAIVITAAPHGRIDAYYGFFLPVFTISEDIKTSVVLIEDGVFCALVGEKAEDIGYPSVSQLVSATIKLDGKVYADTRSCEVRGVKAEQLIEGIEMASADKVAQILIEAQGAVVV